VVVVDTTSADLGLVDALARLQLEARRLGGSIRVQPCDELRELLELVGLSEVLALESRRKTEERIQLGVEEVVQPGDPAV
jgi:hypothetical protein